MSWRSDLWEKRNLVFCTAAWGVIIIAAASWLTVFLIGTLGNPFWKDNLAVRDRTFALAEKKVERYFGEWETQESQVSNHHGSIGRKYEPDKWTLCIKCHGQSPHSRTIKERDFLNMHSLFISCYICHIREQEGVAATSFGWMDLTSGMLCSNPEMGKGVWGEYGAKIVPLSSGKAPQPVKLEEEEAIAVKLHEDKEQLNDHQKAINNKFIHRRCVEMPIHCINCHNPEKASLPYTSLGYAAERAAFLVGEEIADFAKYYETFYVPKPLNVGTLTPEAVKGDAK